MTRGQHGSIIPLALASCISCGPDWDSLFLATRTDAAAPGRSASVVQEASGNLPTALDPAELLIEDPPDAASPRDGGTDGGQVIVEKAR